MNVTFEIARLVDLPIIVAIYNQAVNTRESTADLNPLTVNQKQSWFLNHDVDKNRPLWVIKNLNQQIIGWMSLSDFYGRPAYLHTTEVSLYLDQTYQGQGVGKQALSFLETQVKRYQIETVLAFIFGHNLASQHLFVDFGYQKWAHLPAVAVLDGIQRDLNIFGKKY
ncbi:GNAT family N-acetyltransferase [Liquorilactobacillus vini]|uniref:Sortase related acyltransferase n=1 Tax=Liquorilactobacillus vini DSM 20605 TaxID=1133569 RepID=A0A0R2CDB5_9LACO|nr:GNAT family N-acetyltransferase [Liquorilactobacillus vini]KRM89543.1 sortase related acyltransferase [Liquorilactobacillus vini DSM 20605]